MNPLPLLTEVHDAENEEAGSIPEMSLQQGRDPQLYLAPTRRSVSTEASYHQYSKHKRAPHAKKTGGMWQGGGGRRGGKGG